MDVSKKSKDNKRRKGGGIMARVKKNKSVSG
jgi:hypothetical protein